MSYDTVLPFRVTLLPLLSIANCWTRKILGCREGLLNIILPRIGSKLEPGPPAVAIHRQLFVLWWKRQVWRSGEGLLNIILHSMHESHDVNWLLTRTKPACRCADAPMLSMANRLAVCHGKLKGGYGGGGGYTSSSKASSEAMTRIGQKPVAVVVQGPPTVRNVVSLGWVLNINIIAH